MDLYNENKVIWRHENKLIVVFDRFLFSEAWFADRRHMIKTNLHKMARSRLVKLSIENGQNQWCAAIPNVRRPNIKKILNYIIEVTSYDGPTVSRTLVFAILTLGRRRNCQTLAHIRLKLKKTQMSSLDGSILLWLASFNFGELRAISK